VSKGSFYTPLAFSGGRKMILVDFDNTLCCTSFDLDHKHNKSKSVQWFNEQSTKEDVTFSWANLLLADWLKDKNYWVCTNRGAETHEQVAEVLFALFDFVPSVLYCCGTKKAVLEQFRFDYFLIDNNQEYEPDFLFSENISIYELEQAYNQWRREHAVVNG